MLRSNLFTSLSSEVNGCYLLKGRNGNAWEFELDNTATGRTFEMFKVDEESGWWNIQERVGNSHPNPVHYGVDGDSDDILPPTSGWGSARYSGRWLGINPMPIVEVTSRKTCLADKNNNMEKKSSENSLNKWDDDNGGGETLEALALIEELTAKESKNQLNECDYNKKDRQPCTDPRMC